MVTTATVTTAITTAAKIIINLHVVKKHVEYFSFNLVS